jgi:alpha-glucosidase
MTIATLLGLGISGFPFSGPDIGGFSGSPDAELMLRWFELAALMPFFRIHSAAGTARREPWTFGEPAITIMRRMIHLRLRLLPYIYTLAWQASQTGAPLVRPLWWEFPQESLAAGEPDCFLLGDSLLVAPVLERGVHTRRLHLPVGEWIDFWSGQRFYGPGEIELVAPLERLPLLVRAGALLPVEPEPGIPQIHFFPAASQESGVHGAVLYSDAGEGYGLSRLDRFTLKSAAGGNNQLLWKTSGDFLLPGGSLPFVLQGAALENAQLDGNSLPITGNAFHLPAVAAGERILSLQYKIS